jgi:hypothetical protein
LWRLRFGQGHCVCKQAVLGRKRNDSFVMVTGKGVSTYHETAIGFARKGCYRLLKIALVTDGSGNHFDHKRCASCLGVAEVLARIGVQHPDRKDMRLAVGRGPLT